MFRWRKKNDGFVWNEYVRTTILVRREQRKQRIEDVREAAVDGVKQAGRRSAELSIAGATATARGLMRGFLFVAGTLGDAIAVIATASSLWLADRAGPLWEGLRNPALSAPLLLIGAMAALSALARWSQAGFDGQMLLAAVCALFAIGLGALPHVSELHWVEDVGERVRGLPLALHWSGDAGAAIGIGAMLMLAIGVVSWLVPALMSHDGGLAASSAAPVKGAASGRIEGKAAAITGDQLRLGSDVVRLSGIEAPAVGQVCAAGKSCAANAKAALQKLIGGKKVACDMSGRQSTGEGEPIAMAACQVNGADIAGQLVRGGHVFAASGLFATYASAEREARSAKAGLWRTEQLRPAEQRAKLWDDAKKLSPDGCPIKGTLSGDAKTYHVPWSASYEKAKVRAGRGERWFCSEAEARAAGWKPGDPG